MSVQTLHLRPFLAAQEKKKKIEFNKFVQNVSTKLQQTNTIGKIQTRGKSENSMEIELISPSLFLS